MERTRPPRRVPSVRRPRVVVSGLASEGRSRVPRVFAGLLRNAGVEVVETGPVRPHQIVKRVIEERADAIALVTLPAARVASVALVIELLRREGVQIVVAVGGTLPAAGATRLRALGVSAVLRNGSAVEHFATALRCPGDRSSELRSRA